MLPKGGANELQVVQGTNNDGFLPLSCPNLETSNFCFHDVCSDHVQLIESYQHLGTMYNLMSYDICVVEGSGNIGHISPSYHVCFAMEVFHLNWYLMNWIQCGTFL